MRAVRLHRCARLACSRRASPAGPHARQADSVLSQQHAPHLVRPDVANGLAGHPVLLRQHRRRVPHLLPSAATRQTPSRVAKRLAHLALRAFQHTTLAPPQTLTPRIHARDIQSFTHSRLQAYTLTRTHMQTSAGGPAPLAHSPGHSARQGIFRPQHPRSSCTCAAHLISARNNLLHPDGSLFFFFSTLTGFLRDGAPRIHKDVYPCPPLPRTGQTGRDSVLTLGHTPKADP